MNFERLNILERPQTLKALIVLRESPVLPRELIYEQMDSSKPTKVATLNSLIEEGLIVETKLGRYNRKDVSLTEYGRKVADVVYYLAVALDGEDVKCTSDYIGSSEDSGDPLRDLG